MIKTEWYITWKSSNPMFKEVTWQKFEATIWFKNDLTFWAFDREINQTRIPDPWDHLNIHNESEMNYHEYSDSVHRHVIRLPRDHFTITWPLSFIVRFGHKRIFKYLWIITLYFIYVCLCVHLSYLNFSSHQ